VKEGQPPQINLDELRAKANKERQDRKAEHLSEVEKLAKSKQINNDDVRELLHVSQSTATNYLEELTKQGKIKKSGKAKATTYSS
jgi:Mn-dependent DtxR family transcriptional regulator